MTTPQDFTLGIGLILEEIKNAYAIEQGYEDWDTLQSPTPKIQIRTSKINQ